MRLAFVPAAVLGLVVLALSEPIPRSSPYILHEKRSSAPGDWTLLRRHDSSAILPLRFGLKQSNINKLEQLLYDVSHPESPNYGQHWTPSQIQKSFAPSIESIKSVMEWLSSSGLTSGNIRLSSTKNWLEVNVTVEEAEQLLKTEYHVYGHDSGKEHIACNAYYLPVHVSSHVDIVTPSIHFDAVVGRRSDAAGQKLRPKFETSPKKSTVTPKVSKLSSALDSCSTQITPACLKAMYGINYQPQSPSKNSLGIVEYTPQAYLQSDLDLFARNVTGMTGLVGKAPILVSVDGGYAQTEETGFEYNGESNLDLQYAMSLIGPTQNVTLFQVGDMIEGGTFNNFLDALDASYCTFEGGDDPFQDAYYPDDYDVGYTGGPDCGISKPTNVISTSYSYNEGDLSPFYTARQCAEYAKLGLMGVTVVYSSGDNGVAGGANFCLSEDGYSLSDGTIFDPGFPSTCPFVTSIGATQIKPGGTVSDREIAVQQTIFSGGGFSNHFNMPSYQKTAVKNYLRQNKAILPSSDLWNSTGTSRAFPDISANGAEYTIAVGGQFYLVAGTSASAPVVASMITLINDARITAGKRPVGFINPTIYSTSFASAFNDIVVGSNPGCGTGGFNASVGWDPVTGLGTPNFAMLMQKWLALP